MIAYLEVGHREGPLSPSAAQPGMPTCAGARLTINEVLALVKQIYTPAGLIEFGERLPSTTSSGGSG
jgi:hypothetical protein